MKKRLPSFSLDFTGQSKRVVQTLLTGMLTALPLILTLGIVGWVGNFLFELAGPDSVVGRLLASVGLPVRGGAFPAIVSYLSALVIVLLVLYGFGRFVQSGMKERWEGLTQKLLRRVPLIGPIYDVTAKFVGLFEKREKAELKGMSPVWVHFGGKGGTATLALMPTHETVPIGENEYHVVLIPTAPVPFGGGLFYVPLEWVEPAEFGVEALTSIYVSMGVTAPQILRASAEGKLITDPVTKETLVPKPTASERDDDIRGGR